MKRRSVVLGATCQLMLIALVLAQDRRYTTKYDNLDIDAVIQNERLVANYVGCLLDKRPCTPDAAEYKRNLPDALATNCSQCTTAQKRISDKLSHHLIDRRPADWALLEEKYDPTGAYRKRYLRKIELMRKNPDKDWDEIRKQEGLDADGYEENADSEKDKAKDGESE